MKHPATLVVERFVDDGVPTTQQAPNVIIAPDIKGQALRSVIRPFLP